MIEIAFESQVWDIFAVVVKGFANIRNVLADCCPVRAHKKHEKYVIARMHFSCTPPINTVQINKLEPLIIKLQL